MERWLLCLLPRHALLFRFLERQHRLLYSSTCPPSIRALSFSISPHHCVQTPPQLCPVLHVTVGDFVSGSTPYPPMHDVLSSLTCGSTFDHHAALLPTVDGRWLSVVLLPVFSKASVMALEFEASFGQDSPAVWSVSLRLRCHT